MQKVEEKNDYLDLDWLKRQHYDLGRIIQDMNNERSVFMITIKKGIENYAKLNL